MRRHALRADALKWAEGQKPEIEKLPAGELKEFRGLFNTHLKSISPKEAA